MLTPLDIHNREFKRGIRGYDVNEIDEFLDEVIRDFEALYKENLDLREKIQQQDENIEKYKKMEDSLKSTIILAQQVSEEVKQNAAKEANLITWEATKKAEQIVVEAEGKIVASNSKLGRMRELEIQTFIKLKSFLLTQLELIDNIDMEVMDEGNDTEDDTQTENETGIEADTDTDTDTDTDAELVVNEETEEENEVNTASEDKDEVEIKSEI